MFGQGIEYIWYLFVEDPSDTPESHVSYLVNPPLPPYTLGSDNGCNLFTKEVGGADKVRRV